MKKLLITSVVAAFSLVFVLAGASGAQAQSAAVAGCFPGYTYSTQTGQACSTGAADLGCAAGNTYSTETGALCPASVSSFPTSPSFPNTGLAPTIDASLLVSVVALFAAGALYTLRRQAH